MTPSSVTNSTSTTPAAAASSAASVASTDSLANEQVFLQLLVAQLKYQDPESPADGTQFVTQLAQFADLEQVTQSREDLDSIKQQFTAQPPPQISDTPATQPAASDPSAADTGSSANTNGQ
ncbi:MAG TPA: flagellar hook capping FlgD N-terminal domain-containing protein [Bryobacteraceae bacterium]|jgi:flagellar basal-body rod modification protein FlgD